MWYHALSYYISLNEVEHHMFLTTALTARVAES